MTFQRSVATGYNLSSHNIKGANKSVATTLRTWIIHLNPFMLGGSKIFEQDAAVGLAIFVVSAQNFVDDSGAGWSHEIECQQCEK